MDTPSWKAALFGGVLLGILGTSGKWEELVALAPLKRRVYLETCPPPLSTFLTKKRIDKPKIGPFRGKDGFPAVFAGFSETSTGFFDFLGRGAGAAAGVLRPQTTNKPRPVLLPALARFALPCPAVPLPACCCPLSCCYPLTIRRRCWKD